MGDNVNSADEIDREIAVGVYTFLCLVICCLLTCLAFTKRRNLSRETFNDELRRRKQFIRENLAVKTWFSDEDDVRGAGMGDKEPSYAPENVDGPTPEAPICIICLSHFKQQQLISQSRNSGCKHLFHQDCITAWLEKHDDCPVCRDTYLIESP